MIKATNLTKKYDEVLALDDFTTEIKEGSIYGLVGSNGSGKSTLLRMIAGIYEPDAGKIELDGEIPYENTNLKDKILFVADEPYFFTGSTMDEMKSFYKNTYSNFSDETYEFLCNNFPIDPKKKIYTFSKGMKRQVSLILALASRPKYLLLDEAFDGLDPVIRNLLRKLLADAIAERDTTVIIASHNLRELEDICDHMGLLHNGKIVFQREIDEDKLGICKVQIIFADEPDEDIYSNLEIIKKDKVGSITNMIVRGNANEVKRYLKTFNPIILETVPLTLEEVFVYEMEAVGYDYNKIIF